jgi:undecaprenyl-diphosphatase
MTNEDNSTPRTEWTVRTIPRTHLGAFGILLVVFVGLSLLTAGANVLNADVRFERWVQVAPIPAAAQLARFGSRVGSFTFLGPFTLVVLTLLVWRRWRWDAVFLAMTGVLHSTNSLLKWLIDSPRPTANFVDITSKANGNGFPSGHATGSMLIYGALAIIASRRIRPAWLRRGIVSLCVALILVVGFARIKEGVHWPSDVLGGYLWGCAMLLLASAVTSLLMSRRAR